MGMGSSFSRKIHVTVAHTAMIKTIRTIFFTGISEAMRMQCIGSAEPRLQPGSVP